MRRYPHVLVGLHSGTDVDVTCDSFAHMDMDMNGGGLNASKSVPNGPYDHITSIGIACEAKLKAHARTHIH